jgi:hypothetical protein
MMNRVRNLSFVLLLALSVIGALSMTACKKEAAAGQEEKKLTIPTTDQDEEWKAFVREVAKSKYVAGKTGQVYVRFLGTTEAIDGHRRDTVMQFSRQMARGSMMVYGSYNSRNMAQILIDAFNTPGIEGNLSGSTLVFVGQRLDGEKVKEASVKSGVTLEVFPVD